MHRNVQLLGELSRFGDTWQVEATSVSDVVRLIECQEPEFRKFLIDAADSGLELAIVGENFVLEEPEELVLENLGTETLYFSLIPAGSGKGWGKILLGVVLIVVGAWAGGAFAAGGTAGASSVGAAQAFVGQALIAVGVSLALQGVTQLLAKTPDSDKEKAGGSLFDGPESTLKQGQPVPILYGRLLVGGAPIHVNLTEPGSEVGSGVGIIPRFQIVNGELVLVGDYTNIDPDNFFINIPQIPILNF